MRLMQLGAAGVWEGLLGFDPPLHQLVLQVELEVQVLSLPQDLKTNLIEIQAES